MVVVVWATGEGWGAMGSAPPPAHPNAGGESHAGEQRGWDGTAGAGVGDTFCAPEKAW